MQVRRRTTKQACPLTLTLYVRWFSPQGRTKVNKLLLRPVTSVEALQVCCLVQIQADQHGIDLSCYAMLSSPS